MIRRNLSLRIKPLQFGAGGDPAEPRAIMHWQVRGNSTEGLSKLPIDRCRTIFHLTITVLHAARKALFAAECERTTAAGVARQNSVIYGALTMWHDLFPTCHSDPFQNGVTRTTSVAQFAVPNLPGDSKTT